MAAKKKIVARKPAVTTRSRRSNPAQQEGPRYRLTKESVIGGSLQPVGAVVLYYGLPGSALYPVTPEAVERKKAVLAIRHDADMDDEEKAAALKELSDAWNGVEQDDQFADEFANEFRDEFASETLASTTTVDGQTTVGQRAQTSNPVNTKPLPDDERKELESHAAATVEATRIAQEEDTNFTKVKLQGQLVETDASKQGATPVTDGKESTPEGAAGKSAKK